MNSTGDKIALAFLMDPATRPVAGSSAGPQAERNTARNEPE